MPHSHHHNEHHNSSKNIKTAFFLNISFTLIEILGGFFTNSIAILSDALHDLGDSLSLGAAWYFQSLSKKDRNKNFSYGYKRFSLLGALINSLILLAGSVIIIRESIPRLLHPVTANPKGMFLLAIFGVIVNGAAVLKLKKGKSINERVVSLHLLEDVLGWFAVLVGSMLIYFFEWHFIDPILSLLIAVFILFNIFKNLKQTMKIILQGATDQKKQKIIKKYLNSLQTIKSFHDFHTWSMDGTYDILTVHLVLNKKLDIEEIDKLRAEIKRKLNTIGIEHSTIEFESPSHDCNQESCT